MVLLDEVVGRTRFVNGWNSLDVGRHAVVVAQTLMNERFHFVVAVLEKNGDLKTEMKVESISSTCLHVTSMVAASNGFLSANFRPNNDDLL